MPKPNCLEITCSTACNKLKHARPYPYDLNIYRGCQHGCRYCYALYSHEHIVGVPGGNFYKNIYIKTNIVEQLERQFASPAWTGDVVNIGSVCDSYQPIEEQYKIMPEILKVFIKYKNPCIISTKSKLILRDFDLIDELSRLAHVNIACTITTVDEEVRRKLEPYGATSAKRFEVLKEIKKTKASRGVHIMPILPFITDSAENLEGIYAGAREAGVNYVLPGLLNLKGPTKGEFFSFLNKEYPKLMERYAHFYSKDVPRQERNEYRAKLYGRIRLFKDKYKLYSNYMDYDGVDHTAEADAKAAAKGKKNKRPSTDGEQLSIF